jgi:hypothetical protein
METRSEVAKPVHIQHDLLSEARVVAQCVDATALGVIIFAERFPRSKERRSACFCDKVPLDPPQ